MGRCGLREGCVWECACACALHWVSVVVMVEAAWCGCADDVMCCAVLCWWRVWCCVVLHACVIVRVGGCCVLYPCACMWSVCAWGMCDCVGVVVGVCMLVCVFVCGLCGGMVCGCAGPAAL